MFCKECGMELEDGMQYCPKCGYKLPIYCVGCGKQLSETDKFCIECGHPNKAWKEPKMQATKTASTTSEVLKIEDNTMEDDESKYTHYRSGLERKSKTEQKLLAIAGICIAAITFIYYINNPGEDQVLDTVIMGGITAVVVLSIYGLAAGNLGVFEATEYLKKLDELHNTVGGKEAILFIEREYKPGEHGKGMAAGTTKVAGGCLTSGFQMITGFALSIIAVVVAMAFC